MMTWANFLMYSLFFWMNAAGATAAATLDVEDTLTRINTLRTIHSAPPVQWDTSLENTAYNWAINLNKTNVFKHSNYPYGENLAYFRGVKNATNAMQRAITAWYAENAVYDYSVGGFTAGHFTQLVWINTKYIGAAVINGYVVMEFNPPGNYAGSYVKNVLPPTNVLLSPPLRSPMAVIIAPLLPLRSPVAVPMAPLVSPSPPSRPVLIMTPPNPDIVPIVVIAPPLRSPALRSPMQMQMPMAPAPPKSSENKNLSMSYALLGFCLILTLIYVIV